MSNYPGAPNPDTRPLPAGWISQFDPNYGTWYYVNTTAAPPVTTWEHPLGPPPPAYSPPAGPPDRNSPSATPAFPQASPQGGGALQSNNPYGYSNPQGPYGGYNSNPPYGGNPPVDTSSPAQAEFKKEKGGSGSKLFGGLTKKFGMGSGDSSHGGHASGIGGVLGGVAGKLGGGSHGGHQGAPGYGSPAYGYGGQPGGHGSPFGGFGGGHGSYGHGAQTMYAKPKKSGMGGAGMMAAGAGAGLLGGLLIADAIDDSFDNDYGGGDDFGDF